MPAEISLLNKHKKIAIYFNIKTPSKPKLLLMCMEVTLWIFLDVQASTCSSVCASPCLLFLNNFFPLF